VSLPADDLLDPATNEFLPAGELRRRFDRVAAFSYLLRRWCCGKRRCDGIGDARASRCETL
jgi:hypothetical protein